jgi:predicted amidophosphoribosyltransferase
VDALRELLAVAAPPRCAACGGAIDSGEPICHGCLAALHDDPPLIDRGSPGIDLAVAAHEFEGTARAVVHGLKYGRRLPLAAVAAVAIAAACPTDELEGAVVPVPASPLRWRWRGFDPAEEIALALARRADLPFAACLKRRHGPRQVGRARSSRLGDPPRVEMRGSPPARALLVDDVRTTGATLAACASALRAAGARQVIALTFAYVR